MAYNFEYPYVDAGRYNDDWLIMKMKEFDSRYGNIENYIEALFKKYVSGGGLNLDMQGYVTPQKYGAVGDGSTDDTVAFQKMFDDLEDGGLVILPEGIYNISDTLHIKTNVSIVGQGCDRSDLDNQYPLTVCSSGIRYVGPAGRDMFVLEGQIGGFLWSSFGIYGGSCRRGISGSWVQKSTFENITISGCADVAMYFAPERLTAHSNVMYNVFNGVRIRSTNCLYLGGSENEASNCCWNTFTQLLVDYTDTGITIQDGDNNCFYGVMSYARGSTAGYSLELMKKARSNYFFGYSGSVHAQAVSRNSIMWLDRENGGPLPVIEEGAQLMYSTDNARSVGWHLANNMHNLFMFKSDPSSYPTYDDPESFRISSRSTAQEAVFGLYNRDILYRGAVLACSNSGEEPTHPAIYFGSRGVYNLNMYATNGLSINISAASTTSEARPPLGENQWGTGDIIFKAGILGPTDILGWRYFGGQWHEIPWPGSTSRNGEGTTSTNEEGTTSTNEEG